MGQKKKAAQLLYGKEAAGVLVETDSDDLQREIIQAAIEGRAFRSAGDLAQSLFSDGTEKKVLISTEPTGSLVAASLPMAVLQQEPAREAVQMTLFGEIVRVDVGGRRRKQ
jgi:hypothetical protein